MPNFPSRPHLTLTLQHGVPLLSASQHVIRLSTVHCTLQPQDVISPSTVFASLSYIPYSSSPSCPTFHEQHVTPSLPNTSLLPYTTCHIIFPQHVTSFLDSKSGSPSQTCSILHIHRIPHTLHNMSRPSQHFTASPCNLSPRSNATCDTLSLPPSSTCPIQKYPTLHTFHQPNVPPFLPNISHHPFAAYCITPFRHIMSHPPSLTRPTHPLRNVQLITLHVPRNVFPPHNTSNSMKDVLSHTTRRDTVSRMLYSRTVSHIKHCVLNNFKAHTETDPVQQSFSA